MGKRQFSGGVEPRTFFDRRVRQHGYTRYVALGKIIPEGWDYVRLEVKKQTKNNVMLSITRLQLVDTTAQNSKADKASGQDA